MINIHDLWSDWPGGLKALDVKKIKLFYILVWKLLYDQKNLQNEQAYKQNKQTNKKKKELGMPPWKHLLLATI